MNNFISWCYILLVYVFSCPFVNYEDSLLSAYMPISRENHILTIDSSTDGDAISFGYWSFCIPLQEFKRYPTVEQDYDIFTPGIGQLFFLVKPLENLEPIILGYLTFDSSNLLVIHNIVVEIPQQNLQQFTFPYSTATYEGKWIFTLLTFLPQTSTLIIQMTDQVQQTIVTDFSGISEVQFIIGGNGLINMNSNLYNLKIFRGRLSNLISIPQYIFDYEKFVQISNTCQIPQKLIGEQTLYIVPGLRQFQGDSLLSFIIDEVGNRYCLSGWVKYDTLSIVYLANYTLIRLSAFKDYQTNQHFGDELFYLQVQLNGQFKYKTQIIVYTNPYIIPLQGYLDYDLSFEQSSYASYLSDSENEYYFQGLQQWHFVQYEYGRTGDGEAKLLLQIQFFNELGLISSIFGGPRRVASFTNSNFYLFFGSDNTSFELLRAFVYNFKFEYNYEENKKFLFKACHYSCLTCNGPLKNDCTQCDLDSQRIFLIEQSICKCKANFIDYDGNMICQPFPQEYESVIESEIIAEFALQCQSGYFQISDNQCIKCPQENYIDKLCVDCLYYPLTWFTKPICTQDLVTPKYSTEDAYTLVVRNKIDYDVYVVDEAQNLFLLEGVLDFCNDTSQSDCNPTNYFHLGNLVSVICKENYYFSQFKCVNVSPYCLKSDSKGQCLQCLDGTYLKDNHCFECPSTCKTCKYDQTVICESCLERFTVVDGQCMECGSYCGICKYFYDDFSNNAYIKCYKCVDDSKYLLSLDGQNCLPNTLPNCLYAYQGRSYPNITINALDYYFPQWNDQWGVFIFCGLCERNYWFYYEAFQCQEGSSWGISESCDFAVFNITYASWWDSIFVCLISRQRTESSIIQFSDLCQSYSPNCGTCLVERSKYYCLICSAGYYSERLSGKCKKCPEDLHCYQCVQQDSFSKDHWKINVRAFYQYYIDYYQTHTFTMYGQSQNPDDYEIICSECQQNYELLDNICIISCSESCLECQIINGQNICVRCQLEQNGRRLSLFNNQCIQCSSNCALCRLRSNEEIALINPLFQNTDFDFYSHQCLRSFDDRDYYYDQEIGQFIICSDILNGCQTQFIIPIKLYCSEQKYNDALSQYLTEQEIKQFKQKNILLTEVFSGNSFSQFYNKEFYQMANEKQIKKIIIQIEGYEQRTCKLTGESVAIQLFSENIFSAIDVELEMIFLENTILIYDKTISFENFKKVSISGLTFQPASSDSVKQIIFKSKWPQTVILNKIIYQQEGDNDLSQIIFNDLKSLQIQNLQLLNLVQSEINSFLIIEKTGNQKDILFSQLKIINCLISNQILFLFNVESDDTVTFQNIEINSTFKNASLISSQDSILMAKLKISQFNLIIKINDCQYFFDIYRFKSIHIEQFILTKSVITNTSVFSLNNFATLSEIEFSDSKFQVDSIMIINSDLLLDSSIKITIINAKFQNNIYDETIKFISLKKFGSETSEIQVTQLYLIGNSVVFISEEFNSDQIDFALIYIQVLFVSIQEMEIQRGYGLRDISITEAQKLQLKQLKITQHPNFAFLGLHQYLDCQINQVKGQAYWQSLYIFQTQKIEIINLEIIQAQIYNQPLIFIQSADLGILQQKESIIILNILIKSNLLLLTGLTKQTSLFQFKSSQEISLNISNAIFQDNILHEYVQNQVTDSATLLLIDFKQGFTTISESFFYNNFVTNSSDSILHISSNLILIQNCEFTNNSIFSYQALYPYLLWGFQGSQKIYLSNIKSIFPVQSQSGNGLLRGETINITETKVISSSGSFGGGFQIIAQNWASISLQNCLFYNINSLFSSKDESGGVIYFDGSNAQSFHFQMENISASNINCRYKGGLLYIQAGEAKSSVTLNSIQAYDVYSSLGSLIFLEFSDLATSTQKLSAIGIQIINSFAGSISYLNKFTNSYQSELSILINNRTVIYVNYGSQLVFQNISINNLLIESAFYLSGAQKISILSLQVTNSSTNKNLINIIANKLYESYYIINKFTAIDIKVGQQLVMAQCPNSNSQGQKIYFQCLSKSQATPTQLEEEQILNLDGCLINNLNIYQDLIDSGLIVYTDLNQLNQLKQAEINLKNIDCQNCEQGLVSASFSQTDTTLPRIIFELITILQSQCGKSSCVIFSNGLITNTRILQESKIYKLGYELIIHHYDCFNNTAVNGTCLMISNLKTLIRKSNFIGNNASNSGGSIQVSGNKLFIIEESLIENNTAYQGGGYFSDQLMLNQTNLNTIIQKNKATFYGDDQVSPPNQLTISFNGKILQTSLITQTKQLIIDQVQIIPYKILSDQVENVIYLPTGQEINNYQYYNLKKSTYTPLNWQLRLLSLNQQNIIQKGLSDTKCNIESRLHNITNLSDEPFLNNYTNVQKIQFNDSTQDYNLDNLIIYFDYQTTSDIVLQLQFSCNSIQIPIYNKDFPYNILDFHQNYYLRLNIRSFTCQLGEIKQNDSCIPCNSSQGLYSIQLNAQKCSVMEDVSTISVRSAQLNIKQGFWRPYVDTSEVSYCLNLPENCLGGWVEGDNSCHIGHIGALCEQCDLHNTRGDGSFSISTTYACGICDAMFQNAILIISISIWTLITILISVKSNFEAIKQFIRISILKNFGIGRFQEISQPAILIKMLTNFLQIIAAISTFQLSIPVDLDNTIRAVGNPIQPVAYSLDCLLITASNYEIHYTRMIWQLILPFLYILLFLFIYFIGVKTKILVFNTSVLTTTFIYIYIYLQPNLVGGLVQLISYRKISGFQWIQANVSYRYDTYYHLKWILEFCLPALVIIALILPLYIFIGLYSCRQKLDDKATRLHWGYLYNEYKIEAYFWEVVKIFEKELIIIFLTYYQDNIGVKSMLIQIVVLIYYQLNKKYSPYSNSNLNNLDAQSAQICMISIALGVGIYMSQGQGHLEIQIPFFLLLTIINLLFIITIISRIIIEFIREYTISNQSLIDELQTQIRQRFPFLQSIPFCKRILASRQEQRMRVAKLYKKLKLFLLPQAKQILAFREQQWQTAKIQFIDDPYTQKSLRESSEKQRILTYQQKNISNLILEKKQLETKPAFSESREKQEYNKLPQSYEIQLDLFLNSNPSKN